MPQLGSHRIATAPQAPPPAPPIMALPHAPMQVPATVVTPPQMPPLPPIPWKAAPNPSAHLVQQQYLETRLEELEANRTPGRAAALEVLEEMLLKKLPPNKKQKIRHKELMRIYSAIERNLQSADLTINFMAESWFDKENPYDTYTQMYERAIEGKQMILKDTDVNSADLRAKVDNAITFPRSWQGTQAPAQRGLQPGRQSPDRLQRQMDTGALTDVRKPGETLGAFVAGNKHFNPHTKQIFLALNYGRRPYGSSINYGYSHFVAKPGLKPSCLYYAQDTFRSYTRPVKGRKQKMDAGIQIAYDNLGALLYGNGDHHLQEAIFEGCYEGRILKDPTVTSICSVYLVEAHHFGELTFRDHVDYMVISPRNLSDIALWPTIVQNATKFCRRNGVKLFQTN